MEYVTENRVVELLSAAMINYDKMLQTVLTRAEAAQREISDRTTAITEFLT